MADSEWQDVLLEHRRQKDQAFRHADWSPIAPQARTGFPGLAYYPPDARYRFKARLHPAPEETLEVPLSSGGNQQHRRVGRFRLVLPEGRAELSAFDTGQGQNELFVPFRDATSGTETYGAGRYLEARRLDDGTYRVDLNEAYHPFCAYSEAYACPLPPPENWLQAPVRAGERLPPAPSGPGPTPSGVSSQH